MLSSLTWQELIDLNFAVLRDASGGWYEASNRAQAAYERTRGEMLNPLRERQQGKDADAALSRIKRLHEDFQYINTECGLVRSAVDGLIEELLGPRKEMRDAVDEAEYRKFTVEADGSVAYPEAPTGFDDEKGPAGSAQPGQGSVALASSGTGPQNPNHVYAKDIADRIHRALAQAREADGKYALAIRRLGTVDGVAVSDGMWEDVGRDTKSTARTADVFGEEVPGKGESPAKTKEWWDGLSEADRDRYSTLYPERIGKLDGIPSDVRDEVNRVNIQTLIGKLEGDPGEDAQTKLSGLNRIQEKLDKGSDPPMYLLGVGSQGNGRAIVSYGNPDTAQNVSSYVPGLNTKLSESFANGDLRRAQDTAKGARKYDGEGSTASIAWLGYDAPQIPDGMDSTAVMSEANADRGAPDYNKFMSGISATNQNPDPHVTAVGHSYGSLTVGKAAQQDGGIPGADDIVLVGSPGTGAERASDLNIDTDHVYVGAADNDPVARSPSRATVGGGLIGGPVGAGVGYLTSSDEGWFNTDPANENFGATRFASEDGSPEDAHSNYFDPGEDAQSAQNIARVVAGQGQSVTTQESR